MASCPDRYKDTEHSWILKVSIANQGNSVMVFISTEGGGDKLPTPTRHFMKFSF